MTLSPNMTASAASTAQSDGINNRNSIHTAGTRSSPSSGNMPPGVHVDNPTPHRLPEGENAAPLEVIGTTASDKLVIVMVGLPATGAYRKIDPASV